MNAMNIILKRVLATLTVLVALTFNAMGQGQVKIMVSPKYDPMPPAVLNYIGDPGKYFQISLENVTDEVLNVYLGLEIQQVTPDSKLSLSTPPEALPQQPLVLLPHKLLVLDIVAQKQLFRHLSVNQLRMTGGTLTDYTRGIIALLPEGTYSGQITAYRYNPGNRNPEVLSDPIMGHCMFNVCYSGSAPRFIQSFAPSSLIEYDFLKIHVPDKKKPYESIKKTKKGANNIDRRRRGEFFPQTQYDPFGPRLEWLPPMTACAGKRQYRYSLRIVKAILGQTADEAIQYGADVYRRSGLLSTYCMLPTTIIKRIASSPGMYVCQVTATPIGVNTGEKNNYVLLQNEGKSELLVFEIPNQKGSSDYDQNETTTEETDSEQTDSAEEADSTAQKDSTDTLKCKYHIAQPVLTNPRPDREDAHTFTLQTGKPISVAWNRSVVSEGLAAESDTLTLNYKVEVWKWKTGQTEDSLKASKPLYVKKDITELTDSIPWDELKKAVGSSDRIRLRVTVNYPFGKDGIEIGEDERNFADLTYLAPLDERFPDCHPGASDAIKDKTLGDFSNDNLKGKTVKVGDFDLTVEKIEKTSVTIGGKSKECYKGTGYVTWMPLNSKIKISVKFDTLFINKERQVYDGKVVSAEVDRNFIPYDMFDSWGLDFLGSTETYGSYLTNYLKKDKDLAKYYKWLQDGCMLIDNMANTELGPLTLPLKLPKHINKTPLDIQIMKAEFSANTSWMNVMGFFVMPESDYTSSDVLVFGAPRQCIRPNALFAEAGCLSLLSDVTVKDPDSQYNYTFKAPKKPSNAEDGCYLQWDADTISSLAVEMDMNIPDMIKDDGNGNIVSDAPYIVNVRTRMYSWNDWTATVALDPFQVKDAPGYTFVATGKGITFDHSAKSNVAGFKLPKDYDLKKLNSTGSTAEVWKGFYLDEFTMKFPTVVEVADDKKGGKGGKNKDKRISLSVKGLYLDKSGITFNISAKNIVDLRTCKVGGWSLSLDEIYFDVLQNNFKKAGFNGQFSVPLLKQNNTEGKKERGKIGYDCAIARTQKDNGSSFKYTFKTQQVEKELYLDAFLATMSLEKEQTYFFVESENNKTRVELCMGGKISINGTKDKTFIGLKVPEVAFSGFRLANFGTPDKERSLVEQARKNESNKVKAAENNSEKKNDNVEKEIENARNELEGNSVYEYASPNGDFFFSLGQWKLASPTKKLGSFTFTLNDIGIRNNGKFVGLNLEGSIGFMDDKLVAGAGIVLWGKVDLDNLDFDWDHCQFAKAIIKSGFGGVNVTGSFEMKETTLTVNGKEKKSHGYSGGLSIDMNGLFKLSVDGAWGEAVRTKSSDDEATYSYAAFDVSVDMETGIQIPPVQINGISGGFFINSDINKNPKYGCYGGKLGLTISTMGTDNLVSAPMELTVLYDKERNKLSNFIIQGDVYALYATKPEDAIIKAKARLAYVNTEEEKSLTLNITIDASADMTEKFKDFTGVDYDKISDEDKLADMAGFDAKNDDDSGHKTEGGVKAKAGVKIPIELKITMKPDGHKGDFPTKWHFYLGKPKAAERCIFTFIDFQVGKSSSPIYLRCKIEADAYLCLGNELPDNGELPPLPSKVEEFLGSKAAPGRSQTQTMFREFQGKAKGGVMLGASVSGELALNAVVCYAEIDMIAGFDLALKKLQAAKCGDGRNAGKNGFYANGQIYAYAHGELGLMLNLWIFKGKLPIVDATVGAVLKGGLPNPAWCYGKVKARAKLLGGLIKFNGSVEIKAGHVCMPTFANPLDDIKIFEDVQPGKEDKNEGWDDNNKISVYAESRYTTNMTIGSQLRLVDEKEAYKRAKRNEDHMKHALNAQRVYIFHTDKLMKLEQFEDKKDKSPSKTYQLSSKTSNNESFSLSGIGRLEPNKFYKLTLTGYAKELVKGYQVDPIFNDSLSNYKDEHRAWRDTSIVYFRTGDLPTHILDDVKLARPHTNSQWYNGENVKDTYLEEAAKPYLSLCGSRADKWDDKHEVQVDLEIYNRSTGEWDVPDQKLVAIGCTFDGAFYPMKNGKAVGLDAAKAQKQKEIDDYVAEQKRQREEKKRQEEEKRKKEAEYKTRWTIEDELRRKRWIEEGFYYKDPETGKIVHVKGTKDNTKTSKDGMVVHGYIDPKTGTFVRANGKDSTQQVSKDYVQMIVDDSVSTMPKDGMVVHGYVDSKTGKFVWANGKDSTQQVSRGHAQMIVGHSVSTHEVKQAGWKYIGKDVNENMEAVSVVADDPANTNSQLKELVIVQPDSIAPSKTSRAKKKKKTAAVQTSKKDYLPAPPDENRMESLRMTVVGELATAPKIPQKYVGLDKQMGKDLNDVRVKPIEEIKTGPLDHYGSNSSSSSDDDDPIDVPKMPSVDTVKVVSYAGSKCKNVPVEERIERGENYEYIIWQLANNASFAKFVKPGERYRLTFNQVNKAKQKEYLEKVNVAMKAFIFQQQSQNTGSGGSQKSNNQNSDSQLDLGKYMNDYRKELSGKMGLDTISKLIRTFHVALKEDTYKTFLYDVAFDMTENYSFAATKGKGVINRFYDAKDGEHRVYCNVHSINYTGNSKSFAYNDNPIMNGVWQADPYFGMIYWGNYGTVSSCHMPWSKLCKQDILSTPALSIKFPPCSRRELSRYDGVYNLDSPYSDQMIGLRLRNQIMPKVRYNSYEPDERNSWFTKLTAEYEADYATANIMMVTLRALRKKMLQYLGKYAKHLESERAWGKAGSGNRGEVRKKMNNFRDFCGMDEGVYNATKDGIEQTSELSSQEKIDKKYDMMLYHARSIRPELLNDKDRYFWNTYFNRNNYHNYHYWPSDVAIPYIQMVYIYGINVADETRKHLEDVDRRRARYPERQWVVDNIDKDISRSIVSYDFNLFKVSGYNLKTNEFDVRPATRSANTYILRNWRRALNFP